MAVRTIEQLKTTIQANADKVQINSISPQDVFDTMNDVVDTLNQRAKWANFRCDLLYSKNFAPLTPTGDTDVNKKTYDYCGILSPKSYHDIPFGILSGTYYHQFNTLDLYARISGFPAEEDPTKYGIAVYRRSLRTFKGGRTETRLNRFARREDTFNEPSLRPLSGIYNEDFTRTYKKMVGLKLNGDGWNGQDPEQPSTNWVVPKKISELNQGKYEPLWAMQCGNGDGDGDRDGVRLNIIRGSLLAVYLFGKKVAQKPIKMSTYPSTPPPEEQVRVRFVKVKLPIDIRLVHEITPGVDETIKILWSGNLVIRTMVPFRWNGLLNEWAVSYDHWDAIDSEGNLCNRRYSVDIE